MTRYHITKAGNPGVCRAKIKCRLGDMESEHFDSPEELRKHFENVNKDREVSSIRKKDSVSSSKKKKNKDSYSSILEADFSKFEEEASVLVREFLDSNGEYSPPTDFLDDSSYSSFGDDVEEPVFYGKFRLLGSGYSKNAYLDAEEKFVYKLPNSQSAPEGWSERESKFQVESSLEEKKAYESLDFKRLEEEGLEYARTFYVEVEDSSGSKVPVVVQEYLSPEEYVEAESFSLEEEKRLRRELKIDDLKAANFRRRVRDNKIVLFDCLAEDW